MKRELCLFWTNNGFTLFYARVIVAEPPSPTATPLRSGKPEIRQQKRQKTASNKSADSIRERRSTMRQALSAAAKAAKSFSPDLL